MKRTKMSLSVLMLVVVGLMGTGVIALAAQPTDVPGNGDDFVCPVIVNEAVGMHNTQAIALGDSGAYTVVAKPVRDMDHHLNVPDQATNGGGTGAPGDTTGENTQSMPGDTDYTAIWNGGAVTD
jgi:hypothetical protein